jgi:glycosyltransferase involved in cell wall biosynthesis
MVSRLVAQGGGRVLSLKGVASRTLFSRISRSLLARRVAAFGAGAECVFSLRMGSTPLAVEVGERLGVPVVTYLHGYTDCQDKYLRYKVHLADAVIAVSHHVLELYLRAAGGRNPRQLARVVHNGIDVDSFVARSREFDLRTRLSLPDDRRVVGMAGAYTAKGLEVFLRAAARLESEGAGACFVVAGPFRHASTEAWARRFVADEGLDGACRFLGHQANMSAVMASCDVWALPTLMDAFPLVALEALAVGRPIVASAVGGLPEIVKDGETGLLVPPGDPARLAAALRRLLDDAALRQALSKSGRELVAERFKLESQMRGIDEVLASIGAGEASSSTARTRPGRPLGSTV